MMGFFAKIVKGFSDDLFDKVLDTSQDPTTAQKMKFSIKDFFSKCD